MAEKERIQHEGIVKSVSAQTLEVLISSRSACSDCHARGACGMAETKQKMITALRPEGDIRVGDKVMIYASLNNAAYSVVLAYVMPSVFIITVLFFLVKTGMNEVFAALSGLILAALYFLILYLFRDKISKKIKFTVDKISNY